MHKFYYFNAIYLKNGHIYYINKHIQQLSFMQSSIVKNIKLSSMLVLVHIEQEYHPLLHKH